MIGADSVVSRSARTRSFLLVAALLTALGVLSLSVARAEAVVVTPTSSPLPGSDFQGGDGNQAATPLLRDWQSLVGQPGLVTINDPDATDSTYDTGSHENRPVDWDVSEDPGGVTPAKANFFNSWTYVDETTQDTFLYLAFDREESGGNVFLAFELNQDTRLWTNASGDEIQCRTEGDLIVSYEIQNDDNIDVVIQQWISDSEVTAAEAAAGFTNGLGCSKTGHFVDFAVTSAVVQGAINQNASITNFLPRTPPAATIGEELFGETAINLSQIFEDTIQNPCFSFGQISLHGRSSKSDSASLQDLVGPVPLLVRNCTISGTKYHDIDGDGATPPDGEPTLAGWKLYIDLNNNNLLDAGEPTTLTDANGDYVFADLDDATYTIREAPDSAQAAGLKGFFCSFPSKVDANCEHSVTISARDRNVTGKDFANFKKATVIVEKQTVPDGAAGSFGFTTDYAGDFSLTDGQQRSQEVDPGSYDATENVPAGWTLTDITCSGDTIAPNSSAAGSTATFNAQSGETIKCVFTNTQDATVTIVKDAQPDDAQDFAYTTTGSGWGDFSLDDDADATLPSSRTFTFPAGSFGAKTITEPAVAGWSNTSLMCSEGTVDGSTATLEVNPGDNITCTYVNKQDATVTVIKDAQPDSAQDFDYTTTGAGLSDFSLDDDADATLSNTQVFTVSGGDFGSKTITESAVAGWSNTSLVCSEGTVDGSTATLDVDPGDDITCTYVNKQDAKVTVIKDAQPDAPRDFDYTTTGSQLSDFSLDDDADPTLSNTKVFTVSGAGFGSKTITESAESGWTNTSVVCSEGTVNGSTATLDVDPGDDITCTYVNKRDATVTVIKDAQPDEAQDFAYTTTGTGWSDFSLDDDADATLPSSRTFTFSGDEFGSKTVTESAVAGWSNTSLVCSEGTVNGSTATLDVDPGDTITCTYVNKQDATVTVIKDAQPNAAQDFDYTTTGAGLSDFSLDDDADATLSDTQVFTVSGGDFGSKTITESAVAGWSNTSLVCSEGTVDGSTATLDVDPGDDITCTYVNKQDATVTIVKDAQPDSAQDFDYTTTGAGWSDFSLDDDADATLPSERTFTFSGAEFGSKTVTESAVAGWSNTSLDCSEGTVDGSTATLDVDPGDDITCTYVNKQDATVTVIKDAQPERRAGLRLHDDRVAVERLLARRRRRRDLVGHAGVHGVGRRLRLEDDHRVCGRGLDEHQLGVLGGHGQRVDGDARRRSGRHDHLHVREQAGCDRHGDQGRAAERCPGLRLHDDRRRPERLLARRRRGRDAVGHAGVHGVGRRFRFQDDHGVRGRGLVEHERGLLGGHRGRVDGDA